MEKNSHFSVSREDCNSMSSMNSSQPARRIQTLSGSKTNFKSNSKRHCLHGDQQQQLKDGRERLKRHREKVAGRVLIPDKWGQEDLLKDWIDCSAFEALLMPNKIASARKALVDDHGNKTRPTYHLQQEQLRIGIN